MVPGWLHGPGGCMPPPPRRLLLRAVRILLECILVNSLFSLYSQRGAFVSEPAILVKRKGKGSQIWSMEKFENKIIDMRDMYEERKEKGLPMMVEDPDDEPVLYLLVCVVCMAF